MLSGCNCLISLIKSSFMDVFFSDRSLNTSFSFIITTSSFCLPNQTWDFSQIQTESSIFHRFSEHFYRVLPHYKHLGNSFLSFTPHIHQLTSAEIRFLCQDQVVFFRSRPKGRVIMEMIFTGMSKTHWIQSTVRH